jgi:hypothetical protein
MQAVAIASCVLIAFGNVVVVTGDWAFDDMHAYLGAAERLLSGDPLYISGVATSQLYLYAPWFSAAWIPATGLPIAVVEVTWFSVLAIAFGAALWPYLRSVAGICLALLLGALLYRTLGWGNVQPVVVAALVWSLPTRSGPWVLGVIGSLKPLTLVAVGAYLWRREWRSAAIAVGIAGILWAPALLFDLSSYPAPRSLNLYDASLLLAAVPLLSPPSGTSRRRQTAAAG